MQLLPCLLMLLAGVLSHYIPKINGSTITVSSYTDQTKPIPIPFRKCFQVEPELPANKKYLGFEPSSLQLTNVQSQLLSTTGDNVTVLDDLRSPQSFTHEHLLVFTNYTMSFLSPNTIVIIKETPKFQVTNRYKLKEVDQFSRFKIYKIGEKAILTYYSMAYSNSAGPMFRALLLDENGYKPVQVPRQVIISHMVSVGS